MRTAFRRLSAAAPAFALSACLLTGGDSLVTPGGAEDFPNTVNQLGRIAVGDVSSAGQWEDAQNIDLPSVPDLGGIDSLQVSPPQSQAKRAALGKSGLLAKSADLDTIDFSLWQLDESRQLEIVLFGYVYAYAVDTSNRSEYERRDTVKALYLGRREYDLTLLDSIRANPGAYLLPLDYKGAIRRVNGEIQSYRLRNTDSRGGLDAAEYATITPVAGGGTLRKWVKIYGPDGAVLNPNPVPEEYEILHRGPAQDTLEWTKVLDADAERDRRLWNDSGRGVVDLYLRVRNPASQPELLRLHTYTRAEIRHGATRDSLSQLYYLEQRWMRSGRVSSFTLQGVGTSGSLLRANDSARMILDTVFALRDSMIRYTGIYNLRLGSAPDRMQEHALTGFAISKYWRRGPLFSTVSLFSPTVPVPVGHGDFEGRTAFTAAYVNGDTVQTEGTVTRDSLNLTLRQVKEGVVSTYLVVLDAAGKLLREPEQVLPDATATARRPALRAIKP